MNCWVKSAHANSYKRKTERNKASFKIRNKYRVLLILPVVNPGVVVEAVVVAEK